MKLTFELNGQRYETTQTTEEMVNTGAAFRIPQPITRFQVGDIFELSPPENYGKIVILPGEFNFLDSERKYVYGGRNGDPLKLYGQSPLSYDEVLTDLNKNKYVFVRHWDYPHIS